MEELPGRQAPNMCASQKSNNNKSTECNSDNYRSPFIQGPWEGGGRQAGEVGGEMAQGERVFKSVQAQGWQTLEKSCRKTCGPFRLTGVSNPYWCEEDSALHAPETKIQIPQREGDAGRALGRWALSPLGGVEGGRGRGARRPSSPAGSSGWRAYPPRPAAPSVCRRWCAEGSFSAEVELLRPLAGRPSCGRGCCLRKPRRRGASGEDVLCQVFASGMMNKGKRTEKRIH